MAVNVNKVILAGNLTRDPEKRYTQGGTCIVNMSIAVNRRYKKDENWVDEASFFDVVVWGARGENCAKFLSKGRPVLVDGYLQQRRWETPEGNKRSKVEVVANDVQFLGPRPGGGGQEGGASGPAEPDVPDEPPPLEDDDIPF